MSFSGTGFAGTEGRNVKVHRKTNRRDSHRELAGENKHARVPFRIRDESILVIHIAGHINNCPPEKYRRSLRLVRTIKKKPG